MNKKFCLFVSVVLIVLSSVCVFGQAKDPNAAEVLRRYKESLSWIQSVSMKIDIEIDVDANHPNKWFCPYERHFIFRRDHDRTEWIGQKLLFDEQGNVDPLNSQVIKEIMTGELYVSLYSSLKGPPRGVEISRDYKKRQKQLLDDPEHGAPLFGEMYGGNQLLGESANLHLRNKQEDINGVACYVLEWTTEHGKVIAWIAPEKGYSALKWSIYKRKDRGDLLYDEEPMSSDSWLAVFDSVQVQEVNGVFVTTGGHCTETVNADGRTHVFRHEYKVSEVEINPDFEALGAFKVDLPNGTRVFVTEFPGIRQIWQNGKIVPDVDAPTFEEIDKMVDELKKENQANN